MNIFEKIYCRVFQTAFRAALPVLPYREPEIIRSCAELDNVIEKEQITSVLIVTDQGIVKNGLAKPVEDVLKASGVSCRVYADTQPNPIRLEISSRTNRYPGPCLRRNTAEYQAGAVAQRLYQSPKIKHTTNMPC